VNVMAATNRDLERMVRDKQFRSDLFFRLAVLRLHMVPLRERRGDIPILARHFSETTCAEDGISTKVIAPATLALLHSSDWPGNVRELFNVMQRALAFAQGPQILPSHLAQAQGGSESPSQMDCTTLRVARARFERNYLIDLLRAHRGNITQAAHTAGQDRRALARLIKRHNIQSESA
jgi:DNA-binding NtrC family response regulator